MLKVANLNFFILLEVNFVEIKTFIITLKFQENFWFLLFSYVDVFVIFIIFDYWYFLFLFLFSCRIWGNKLPLPPTLPHIPFTLLSVFLSDTSLQFCHSSVIFCLWQVHEKSEFFFWSQTFWWMMLHFNNTLCYYALLSDKWIFSIQIVYYYIFLFSC